MKPQPWLILRLRGDRWVLCHPATAEVWRNRRFTSAYVAARAGRRAGFYVCDATGILFPDLASQSQFNNPLA